MANILDHSMPEILDPADGYPKSLAAGATADDNEMIEYNYTYRVRCQDEEDDVSSLEGDNFLNCYVAFREVMNPTAKAMRRQSLVIVTRWPFPHFAYRLLGKIEEALWHVFTTGPIHEQVTVPGTEGSKLSRAAQALHVAYGQFLSWPPPAPDTPLSLPFFGEVMFGISPSGIQLPLSLSNFCVCFVLPIDLADDSSRLHVCSASSEDPDGGGGRTAPRR